MSKQVCRSFLILVLVILVYPTEAADPIRFKQNVLSLPTSSYGAFLIDQDGFVWIGTTGYGVQRYDGHELKSFGNSFHASMISSIVEDQDGTIWVASFSNGITSYNKQTGAFTWYKHESDNSNSLGSNNISFSPQEIFVDSSNNLWVGTDDAGLSVYNIKSDTWTRYQHSSDNANSLSDNSIVSITEDRVGNIWVGTQTGGLNQFNLKKGTWTHFVHDPQSPESISDNWICSLLEDTEGILWIGTKNGGLNKFDNQSKVFTHYLHDASAPQSIGGNEVWSILEDSSGRIWTCHMVSSSSGIELFDKESETFTRYSNNLNDPTTISSNSVPRIYEDPRTNSLWVVNHDGRIDRHDKNAIGFRNWTHDPNNENSLSDKSILPMIEGSDHQIWVGTMGGGLNSIDRKSGKVTRYLSDTLDPNSIPRARVTAIAEDSSGKLWLGFWDGILAEFDQTTGKYIRIYEHDKNNPNSITKSERLKYILEDQDDSNILWLATIKGGIDKFDKKREHFTHFQTSTSGENSLSHDSVVSLYDDGQGTIWIPTYGGGLDKFDKATESFTNYRHQVGDTNSLGSNTLYEVAQADEDSLWIVRKGGLSLFDIKSESFKNFHRDSDGIKYGAMTGILKDDSGVLWLGTIDRGFLSFDPVTETTKRFTVEDGVSGNSFFWTSRLKTKDGTLWFGGINGITSFHPSQITENPLVPSIVLTAFTQGGESIEIGSSPERLKKITLDWQRNYFEFQFSALNFTAAEKINMLTCSKAGMISGTTPDPIRWVATADCRVENIP
ncbi:MAG: two-component regulator propeller domain-containing protein [Pirellulales bacterium]